MANTYENKTREELLKIIEELEQKKKYGLVWDEERIPEQVVQDCQNNLPVLKEVKGKEITSNDNEPTHILIEGDNYHALSVLNYTHKNKIDVIYIDPPYNTGNKDFIYNDKFVDKEDTYRHSKWLAFMKKRLELARNLLKDTGVIFISIDDNEVAQLKLLCDKIFGENNFVDYFIWNKTSTPPALSRKSRKTHEFIICCQKQNDSRKFIGLVSEGGDAPLLNEGNKEITLQFPQNFVRTNLNDGIHKAGLRNRVFLENDVKVSNGYIQNSFKLKGKFRWSQETLNNEILNNCMLIVKSDNFAIRYCREGDRSVAPPNFITERFYEKDTTIDKISQNVDTNEKAGKELLDILGHKKFDYPKPTSLIQYLINFIENKNSLILDFFAGSGTTLHATQLLNLNDDGKRECILVTNNENNICTDVCYPRVQKVMKGYKNSKGENIEGLGGNLKYFKTAFVKSARNKDQMKIDITHHCTEMLCLKEGIFTLIKEKDDYKIFQHGSGEKKRTMAVHYNFIGEQLNELKKEMNKISGEKVLYCFTLDANGLNAEDFFDWKNTRLEPIPQKILDVYKRLFAK